MHLWFNGLGKLHSVGQRYIPNPLKQKPKPKPSSSAGRLLGGSWDFVRKVMGTLIGLILVSIITLIITLITKSDDPVSRSLHKLSQIAELSEASTPESSSICIKAAVHLEPGNPESQPTTVRAQGVEAVSLLKRPYAVREFRAPAYPPPKETTAKSAALPPERLPLPGSKHRRRAV